MLEVSQDTVAPDLLSSISGMHRFLDVVSEQATGGIGGCPSARPPARFDPLGAKAFPCTFQWTKS